MRGEPEDWNGPLSASEFVQLAERVPAFTGVMAARVAAEQEAERQQAEAKAEAIKAKYPGAFSG